MHGRDDGTKLILKCIREGGGRVKARSMCLAEPYIVVQVYVQVMVAGKEQVWEANGLATCGPKDKWSVGMGELIARGRAETKLAKMLGRTEDARAEAACSVYLDDCRDEMGRYP